MNHESVKSITYRKLSIHNLIGHLAKAEPNILAIGRNHSWIINARTSHFHRFIGTRKPLDLPPRLRNKEKIAMLKDFATRYAGIGSPIRVIYLHQGDFKAGEAFVFVKSTFASFQAPGCSLPATNGVKVPSFVVSTAKAV